MPEICASKRIPRLKIAKILATLLFLKYMYRSYTEVFLEVNILLDVASREEGIMPTQRGRPKGVERERNRYSFLATATTGSRSRLVGTDETSSSSGTKRPPEEDNTSQQNAPVVLRPNVTSEVRTEESFLDPISENAHLRKRKPKKDEPGVPTTSTSSGAGAAQGQDEGKHNTTTMLSQKQDQELVPQLGATPSNEKHQVNMIASTASASSTMTSMTVSTKKPPFIPISNSEVILYDRGHADPQGNTDTTPQRCQIGSNWKFLSSGGAAFAFSADFACWPTTTTTGNHDSKDTSSNNHASTSAEDFTVTDIVIRLHASSDKNTTTHKRDRYIKSSGGRDEDSIAFSRQLQGNWTAQQFDDHFVTQIGIVQLPCDFLLNVENVPLRDTHLLGAHTSTDCGGRGNVSIPTVSAEMYNFAHGNKMDYAFVGALSKTRRAQIAKNIIFKTRHMYEQQVIHCDLNTLHIMVQEVNQQQQPPQQQPGDDARGGGNDEDAVAIKTRMIDFERRRNLVLEEDASKKSQFQRNQFWHLLYLVGVVCGYNNENKKDKSPPSVDTSVCHRTPYRTPNMTELLPFMQQCEFERPLEWNSDDLLYNTPKAYKTLSKWVGID